MKWFKALSRLYRIPKVRRLKESDRWRYVACLAVAGDRDSVDGELPDIADLAIHLGVTERSLRTSCANIVEVGLFEWDGDDNHVRVLKWAEHQNTRKDTQKQYRERQKKAPLRNGDVTGEVKRPLEESRVDKIRLEEKREEKDSAREKAKPREVVQVVEYMQSYGQEKGYVLDFATNGERFWDFYASKGWKVGNAAMKDWKSAARNWVRSQHERQSTGKANGIDRRSSQERANRLGVADVKDDAIGALRLIQAMRGETGHEESDGRDDTLFLGDGS